jgi:hypothetical protein
VEGTSSRISNFIVNSFDKPCLASLLRTINITVHEYRRDGDFAAASSRISAPRRPQPPQFQPTKSHPIHSDSDTLNCFPTSRGRSVPFPERSTARAPPLKDRSGDLCCPRKSGDARRPPKNLPQRHSSGVDARPAGAIKCAFGTNVYFDHLPTRMHSLRLRRPLFCEAFTWCCCLLNSTQSAYAVGSLGPQPSCFNVFEIACNGRGNLSGINC